MLPGALGQGVPEVQPETIQGPGGVPEIAARPTDPRAREQLLGFLGYASMSMDNRLMAGHSVGDVLEALTRAKSLGENPLDADPTLQRRSRELISFLVLSRDRLTPAQKDAAAPVPLLSEQEDPMLVFGLALFAAYFEAMKDGAIANWQRDYDDACRKSYKDLMPLARVTATGRQTNEPAVGITPIFDKQNWVRLAAVNRSQQTLTNVTLAVRMETIDGRFSDHYYFIPTWEKGFTFPLRTATDWDVVGADATTSAQVEVVSDQVVMSRQAFRVDDHVPTAGTKFLGELEVAVRSGKHFKHSIDRLEKMTGPLTAHPALAARRSELEREARERLSAILAVLDEKIKAKLDERSKVSQSQPRPRSNAESIKQFRERKEHDLDKIDAQLKALRAERAEWFSGKR
ncbi:MAG: hypothetical protein DYG92_07545 [Leptolyngbya sp. PLA1]|nr:hypothetical protein [Leptolyngbya sp. PLA1]